MLGTDATPGGERVLRLLESLGFAPLRRTDRHWRLGNTDPMVDVEVDEERRLLNMTCGRLCLVPEAIRDEVQAFCLEHNRSSRVASYVLEGKEVVCRMQLGFVEGEDLTVQRLGQALAQLQQEGRSFIDRLMCRCLDDLVFRIRNQPENEHDTEPS